MDANGSSEIKTLLNGILSGCQNVLRIQAGDIV